jgi:hypothetical protein
VVSARARLDVPARALSMAMSCSFPNR